MGDPPGTHRYWDGSQWQGGPQPIQGVVIGAGPAVVYANPGARFVAFLIDSGIPVAGMILSLLAGTLLSLLSEPLGVAVAVIGYIATTGFVIYNQWYLQGTTGQSVGKKLQEIKIVEIATGQPVGVLMIIVRQLVIGVFAIPCYLDHWYILIDSNKQRLSDNTLKFHVIRAEP